MIGFALIAGCGLLGSTWLMMKISGNLELCARQGRDFLVATFAAMAVVSARVPDLDTPIRDRCFLTLDLFYLLPVVAVAIAYVLWRAVERDRRTQAFLLSSGLSSGCPSWAILVS